MIDHPLFTALNSEQLLGYAAEYRRMAENADTPNLQAALLRLAVRFERKAAANYALRITSRAPRASARSPARQSAPRPSPRPERPAATHPSPSLQTVEP